LRLFPRTSTILLALAPLALAGAAAGPAAGATAAPACSAWNGAQPVDPDQIGGLNGIAALTQCDAWAVGFQAGTTDGDPTRPLIEHWAGGSWTAVPTSTGPGTLSSVSAVSASDIWAAGSTQDGALILRYDGTGWTRTPTPSDNVGTSLFAVDGRTASDAWAAGDSGSHPLLMHWDGTNWAPFSLPTDVPDDITSITSVSADSATDVWAVAQVTGPGSALLHWDGSRWQSFSSTLDLYLSVTALSPTSVWAVGFSADSGHAQTVTVHYDGTHMNVVPSPNPGGTGQGNVLTAVTATSDSDVWAAGRYGANPGNLFALHWNGSSWSVASPPVSGDQATRNGADAISASAPGQAWMAGSFGDSATGQYAPFAAPVPVVPDVTRDTVDTATSALTAAGLTVSSTQNTTTNCTPSVTGNNVLGTDPAAGQQASFGQAVTLTVCGAVVSHPAVTVPDVTGEDDATARSDITAAGLAVGTITVKVDCTIPRGQVVSQSPAGGSTAPFGSRVNLIEATRSGATAGQVTPQACTH